MLKNVSAENNGEKISLLLNAQLLSGYARIIHVV